MNDFRDGPRPNTTDEMIEICRAIKDGKKLEQRPISNSGRGTAWTEMSSTTIRPQFAFCQYRVKREPRVMWGREMLSGVLVAGYDREDIVDNLVKAAGGRKIKFVEVTEE